MATIKATDIIYATIYRLGGNIIASLRLSGITDMAGILRSLREALPAHTASGLVTVSVRNSSAGWNHTQRVMLRRQA